MKTILVVDDDKMILRLATEALISYGEGFNVITASNGQEALDILNSSNIDFVITDIKMPVMDGYELLSHMTRDHRNIPILVMTGFNTPGLEKRLKQKGILHFIEKPFEINLLRKKYLIPLLPVPKDLFMVSLWLIFSRPLKSNKRVLRSE